MNETQQKKEDAVGESKIERFADLKIRRKHTAASVGWGD